MERGRRSKPLLLSIAVGRGPGGGALLAILLVLTLVSVGCQQVERLAEVAPRAIMPGPGPRINAVPVESASPAEVTLPPEQRSSAFDWEPLGADAAGNRQFKATIRIGGSPSLIALEKLTPLFNVDGKGPVEYTTEAFFAANPHRTPRSIQPDDTFVLTVPADTFVVRWQEEDEDGEFGLVRFRDYVSDRGDRLRLYVTDRYPILYQLEAVDKPGQALLRFHPDLAYLLGSGRLDAIGLARLVYRVDHPDLVQMRIIRKLAAEIPPGQAAELMVDRTRTYLDPVRQAMAQATIVEQADSWERRHLTRAVFIRQDVAPFLAVEDALGTRPDIGDLPAGQVFRIEFGRDGVVRVSYLTGDDDERGRRDPYQLRENERWAALYAKYQDSDSSPVAWGPGEPSDIPPFTTARDPNRRVLEGERSYDYLVAGRAILLTFRPQRTRADTRTEAELGDLMKQLSKQYKGFMDELQGWVPELRR